MVVWDLTLGLPGRSSAVNDPMYRLDHRVGKHGLQQLDGEQAIGVTGLWISAERDQGRRLGKSTERPGEAQPVDAVGKTYVHHNHGHSDPNRG